MNTTTEEKPLTVKEAAMRLRLSGASVYALCAAKKIRHLRVGVGRGKILIPPQAVEEYLTTGTVTSVEPITALPAPVSQPRPVLRHMRLKP